VKCLHFSPAHIYTYTFEPNPRWKSYYAYAPEIQQYFLNFCEKYQLRKYIKLNHKVISATWHNDKGQYEVEVEHDGKVLTDWCNILINGSGFLNKWKWPSIDGLHSFGGKLLHSAAWDRE
jgi:cation diffusion facilitator CzcD-associated flavoprotein CzcO